MTGGHDGDGEWKGGADEDRPERDGDPRDGLTQGTTGQIYGIARLTDREKRVARLAAEGLTSREVADRLGVSKRTVDSRLRKIFTKLDIGSRHGLASLFERGDGDGDSVTSASIPSLSSRQVQVLELVADGMRDKEIAKRLSIGIRTAEDHVARLLDKLDFTSRGEIIKWAHTQWLGLRER